MLLLPAPEYYAGPAIRLNFVKKAFSQPFRNIRIPKFGSCACKSTAHLFADVKKNGIGVDFVQKTHAQQTKSHMEV